MLQNVKWPHWVLLVASALTVAATWLMQQNASGGLALPAVAVSALTVLQVVLGLFSPSAAPSKPAAGPKAFAGVGAVFVMLTLCAASLVGCSWFGANSQTVETDVGQVAACVLSQVLGGKTDPMAVTAACSPATLADVVAIVESLLNFYENPPADAGPDAAPLGHADPAFVARLHLVLDSAKTALAKAKH